MDIAIMVLLLLCIALFNVCCDYHDDNQKLRKHLASITDAHEEDLACVSDALIDYQLKCQDLLDRLDRYEKRQATRKAALYNNQ